MKLAAAIFGNSSWYVTSPFGPRTHPTKKTKDHHNGTDYGTSGKKLPQYALEDGKVLRASTGTNSGWGNLVEVDYPRIGISTFHAHLDTVAVKAGQAVKAGTLLGTTGTTGNSTGIHLHLGLRNSKSEAWLNPHNYDYTPPSAKVTATPAATKSVDDIAREVIRGDWGNGEDRRRKLKAAGHNPTAVQKRVNELLKK